VPRKPPVSFAQFVRDRRKAKGDRQIDAAEAVGVVESTWRSYEQGKMPMLHTAYRVADYLGITLDELRPHVETTHG
jgi:transcriptional regulator with XRE-family HTH domain